MTSLSKLYRFTPSNAQTYNVWFYKARHGVQAQYQAVNRDQLLDVLCAAAKPESFFSEGTSVMVHGASKGPSLGFSMKPFTLAALQEIKQGSKFHPPPISST